MKRIKSANLKAAALVAVGVILGRGAQADTLLDFDALPPGQTQNTQILASFGSNAGASSAGVSVTGSGTPDISLNWPAGTGVARWDYYVDSVWSGAQLNGSLVGSSHSIVFTPGSTWAVALDSFNLHGYYADATSFVYTWSVLDGATVLTSGTISFVSDATKNHAVNVGYTGSAGEVLTLRLDRTGGDGDGQNILLDDLRFDQVVQVPEPGAGVLLAFGGLAGLGIAARKRHSRAKDCG